MAQRSPRQQPASRKSASKSKSPVKPPPAARKAPPSKARSTVEPPQPALPEGETGPAFPLPFELDPRKLEEGLRSLQGELVHWANKGRYTRVRFKFRGKQLLPDLPLAVVVAAEGLTFYWAGILRTLMASVAGASLLTVELVNDADKRVQVGRECLLSGEVEEAQAHFREALAMDRDNAAAHLNLGVTYKLQGRRELAVAALEKALQKDPEGAVGSEAERLLKGLRPAGPQAS